MRKPPTNVQMATKDGAHILIHWKSLFPKARAVLTWRVIPAGMYREKGYRYSQASAVRHLELSAGVHGPTFHHLLRSLRLRCLMGEGWNFAHLSRLDAITHVNFDSAASITDEESIKPSQRFYMRIKDPLCITLKDPAYANDMSALHILRLLESNGANGPSDNTRSVCGGLQIRNMIWDVKGKFWQTVRDLFNFRFAKI